jgi:hypothetical protein
MPKWTEGLRQLSDDIKTLRAWVWALGALAAMSAGFWWWWAYWAGMPAPVLALGVLASFWLLLIALYLAALIGHRYFLVPVTDPRYVLEHARRNGTTKVSSQRAEWLSETEKQERRAQRDKVDPLLIAEGEFVLNTKRDKHGHLYVRVENCKDEPKTGYTVRLTNLRIWSEKLNAIGGFARYPAFVDYGKPIELIETEGSRGRLEHVAPALFELIRNPGVGPWHVRNKQDQVVLQDGVWLFEGELHWDNRVIPFTHHVRLKSDKHSKTAEFVSWDAPQHGG